jgi:peptide deformylase
VERQICVVDVTVGEAPEALHVLVNPEVSLREGLDIDVEGCLSIPDFSDKVPRPVRIEVSFQSLEGERLQLEAEGFLARAICHEIDHLHGILFVDHLRGLRKERAKRHLKRLGREAEVVT